MKDKRQTLISQISTNKKIGKAYFQRAEVLSQMVDIYRSDELDFCDRLVYDLASEDYNMAYKNKQFNWKKISKQISGNI